MPEKKKKKREKKRKGIKKISIEIGDINFLRAIGLLVGIIAFLMIEKFIITIILNSIVIAYIIFPFFRFINEKIGHKTISAFIAWGGFIIVIIVVTSFLILSIIHTVIGIVNYLRTPPVTICKNVTITRPNCTYNCQEVKKICYQEKAGLQKMLDMTKRIRLRINDELAKFGMEIPFTEMDIINAATLRAHTWAKNQLENINLYLSSVFNVSFILVLSFFFVRDGHEIKSLLLKSIPQEKSYVLDLLIKDADKLLRGLIYGHFLTATLVAATAFLWLVFLLKFELSQALVVAMITFFAALVPFIGNGVVCICLIIYYYIIGNLTNVALSILLFIILTFIDDIARPFIAGRTTELHPALLFVGIISGSLYFGFSGIVLGPLVLGLLHIIIKLHASTLKKMVKMP
jgi:predicted PurR-regulated permease PerM